MLVILNSSMFFDACDGIFLNYNWNDGKLQNSLDLAKNKGRDMDVYVGIDVFGRGCLGGGGYNTVEVRVTKSRTFIHGVILNEFSFTSTKKRFDHFVITN